MFTTWEGVVQGDYNGTGNDVTSQILHEYCVEWRRWCFTRRYFLRPGVKNILARMQPSKVRLPPDAVLSADLNFLNMAIHALADMGDADTECFVLYYFDQVKNVKKVAADMGIHRDTFYERRSRFARRAYSLSLSLKRAHGTAAQTLAPEAAEVVD